MASGADVVGFIAVLYGIVMLGNWALSSGGGIVWPLLALGSILAGLHILWVYYGRMVVESYARFIAWVVTTLSMEVPENER